MDPNRPKAVVALFASRAQAESATDELWHAGFRHNQIGMAVPGGPEHEATTRTEQVEERAATGTTRGAMTGGVLGAVAGAAAISFVPGVGPVLAGELLLGVVVGGAAGAAVGTFAGPFLAMGLAEDEAHYFGNEVRGGRTVLVVKPEDVTQEQKAIEVMRSHGGEIAEPSVLAMH
jgi:uncharacterized membrane protein